MVSWPIYSTSARGPAQGLRRVRRRHGSEILKKEEERSAARLDALVLRAVDGHAHHGIIYKPWYYI